MNTTCANTCPSLLSISSINVTMTSAIVFQFISFPIDLWLTRYVGNINDVELREFSIVSLQRMNGNVWEEVVIPVLFSTRYQIAIWLKKKWPIQNDWCSRRFCHPDGCNEKRAVDFKETFRPLSSYCGTSVYFTVICGKPDLLSFIFCWKPTHSMSVNYNWLWWKLQKGEKFFK